MANIYLLWKKLRNSYWTGVSTLTNHAHHFVLGRATQRVTMISFMVEIALRNLAILAEVVR